MITVDINDLNKARNFIRELMYVSSDVIVEAIEKNPNSFEAKLNANLDTFMEDMKVKYGPEVDT